MSLRTDFQDFLKRGNVVDLAVGVMIGAAFGKIVTAFVNDLVMPMINPLLPTGQWREAAFEPVPGVKLLVGHFAGTVLDFLITAFVVFLVLVKFVGFLKRREAAPPPPDTKTCGECRETIPKLAKRCKFCTSVVAVTLILLFSPGARAQAANEPKFAYAKPEEAKSTDETKLQAKGGLVVLGGNSRQTTGSLGATGALRRGGNRLSSEVTLAYARASLLVARLAPGDTVIDSDAELGREATTASKLLSGRARYDRFLSENNAAYALGHVLSDEPAGKALVAGAQVGYSRQLLSGERHRLVAELGYDFSYEKGAAEEAVGLQIHSGRVFMAEELKVSDSTGAFLSVEALANLNEEKAPAMGYEPAAAFEDLRLLGKAGLTTTLWRNVSFGFGFTIKYDRAPAPLKAPKGATFGPAFFPLSETLDMLTEATLVVSFL